MISFTKILTLPLVMVAMNCNNCYSSESLEEQVKKLKNDKEEIIDRNYAILKKYKESQKELKESKKLQDKMNNDNDEIIDRNYAILKKDKKLREELDKCREELEESKKLQDKINKEKKEILEKNYEILKQRNELSRELESKKKFQNNKISNVESFSLLHDNN